MDDDGQGSDLGRLNAREALRVALKAPDSYGLVLALLLVSFILAPVVQRLDWLWVLVLVQGATMLFALHTSRVHRRTMRVAVVIVAVSLLLAFAATLNGGRERTEGGIEILLALLLAVCVPAMLRRILTANDIGVDMVIGALDVYIIFGMFFSAVYAALGDLSSHPFFTARTQVTAGSYQFFSFVTLTTVGYGNLVPATQLGQSLAVMEALLGQVYLVTLVARLVSGLQPGGRRRALERLVAEQAERDKAARITAGTDSVTPPTISVPAVTAHAGSPPSPIAASTGREVPGPPADS